ncbi:hypothetical protein RFX61_18170, partial [Acinetobacter baumannii]|nr:hypothetical protein [Acinetobacter baumannii]
YTSLHNTPFSIYSLVLRTTQAKKVISSFLLPNFFAIRELVNFANQKKSDTPTALSLKNNNVNIST